MDGRIHYRIYSIYADRYKNLIPAEHLIHNYIQLAVMVIESVITKNSHNILDIPINWKYLSPTFNPQYLSDMNDKNTSIALEEDMTNFKNEMGILFYHDLAKSNLLDSEGKVYPHLYHRDTTIYHHILGGYPDRIQENGSTKSDFWSF
jgi:hypothetical protein